MTELLASDAAYSLRQRETNLLQHADDDIGYSCGPYIVKKIEETYFVLKGSYDAISSFAFSLECYKLIVHR